MVTLYLLEKPIDYPSEALPRRSSTAPFRQQYVIQILNSLADFAAEIHFTCENTDYANAPNALLHSAGMKGPLLIVPYKRGCEQFVSLDFLASVMLPFSCLSFPM